MDFRLAVSFSGETSPKRHEKKTMHNTNRKDFYHKAVSHGRHPRSFDRRFRTELWSYIGESKHRVGNVKLGQHLFDVTDLQEKTKGSTHESADKVAKPKAHHSISDLTRTLNEESTVALYKSATAKNETQRFARYD